jgi:hypothetical protein
MTLEYSILKWHRTLSAPQTVTDDYTESSIVLNRNLSVEAHPSMPLLYKEEW